MVHVDELPVSPLWVFKLPFDPEHPGQIVSELVIPFIARDVNASSNRATLLNLRIRSHPLSLARPQPVSQNPGIVESDIARASGLERDVRHPKRLRAYRRGGQFGLDISRSTTGAATIGEQVLKIFLRVVASRQQSIGESVYTCGERKAASGSGLGVAAVQTESRERESLVHSAGIEIRRPRRRSLQRIRGGSFVFELVQSFRRYYGHYFVLDPDIGLALELLGQVPGRVVHHRRGVREEHGRRSLMVSVEGVGGRDSAVVGGGRGGGARGSVAVGEARVGSHHHHRLREVVGVQKLLGREAHARVAVHGLRQRQRQWLIDSL